VSITLPTAGRETKKFKASSVEHLERQLASHFKMSVWSLKNTFKIGDFVEEVWKRSICFSASMAVRVRGGARSDDDDDDDDDFEEEVIDEGEVEDQASGGASSGGATSNGSDVEVMEVGGGGASSKASSKMGASSSTKDAKSTSSPWTYNSVCLLPFIVCVFVCVGVCVCVCVLHTKLRSF
jgi:hypothetical protein